MEHLILTIVHLLGEERCTIAVGINNLPKTSLGAALGQRMYSNPVNTITAVLDTPYLAPNGKGQISESEPCSTVTVCPSPANSASVQQELSGTREHK